MSSSVMVSSYSDVKHASLWTVVLVFQQFTIHRGDLSLGEPSSLTNICHQFPLTLVGLNILYLYRVI